MIESLFVRRFMEEMIKKEGEKDETVALAQSILGKCHPDAVGVIRHWITIIQSRWDEVMGWANQVSNQSISHNYSFYFSFNSI